MKALLIIFLALVGGASCLAAASAEGKYPSGNIVVSTQKDSGRVSTIPNQQESHKRSLWKKLSSFRTIKAGMRSTFLPSGYPNSVPDGYLSYCVWSWIQDLSTQLRSVLATQRILEGVGVGREGATALSAMLNFLVRDGCGMFANLAFTSVAASRFSSDIKRWRIFADCMVDIGITLEVLALSLDRRWFLPLLCLGNSCKALCGVAAGAAGGAINLHWSGKGTDISDIQAKFGAQHTVTGSLGLLFAAVFATSVNQFRSHSLWTLYTFLTILHIIANIRCMRIIQFDSFNTSRLRVVLEGYFSPSAGTKESRMEQKNIKSPAQVTREEPLFFMPKRVPVPIAFGVPFEKYAFVAGRSPEELAQDLETAKPYFVTASSSRRPTVAVMLSRDCTPEDRIKAYFEASITSKNLLERGECSPEVLSSAQILSEELWPQFSASCRSSGWDLTSSDIRTQGYEVHFENSN